MSDERDETRRYPSAGRPDPGPGDETRLDGPQFDDRTQVGGSPIDDRTQVAGPAVGPLDDRTQVAGPPVGPLDDRTRVNRPDSTSVMPPADDWAPSRANPVWSGRAEVRAPLPGRSPYDTDWPGGPVPPQQRDRWWMPILVGIIVLILLAALGWGIYLIVQNSGNRPAPAPTTTVDTTATATATASAETTPPSTEPTTAAPSPTPSTTEPTTVATVPALRGLAVADARAALARTGLKSRLIYRDSDDAPPNTVIDSDPTEGQEVPPDTTVTLVVARGATTGPTTTPTTTTPAGGVGGD